MHRLTKACETKGGFQRAFPIEYPELILKIFHQELALVCQASPLTKTVAMAGTQTSAFWRGPASGLHLSQVRPILIIQCHYVVTIPFLCICLQMHALYPLLKHSHSLRWGQGQVRASYGALLVSGSQSELGNFSSVLNVWVVYCDSAMQVIAAVLPKSNSVNKFSHCACLPQPS